MSLFSVSLFSESTWLLLDHIGTITGLITLPTVAYSAWKWWEHIRREKVLAQRIPIRLVNKADNTPIYSLPFQPPRRTVTRAEVMGLLGAIPSAVPGKRFEWVWPHQPDFMLHLEEIYAGSRQELRIPLSEDEFTQLNLSASRASKSVSNFPAST